LRVYGRPATRRYVNRASLELHEYADALAKNPGQFIPLTRGKIAIEIEYAEIWFRRIEVKAI